MTKELAGPNFFGTSPATHRYIAATLKSLFEVPVSVIPSCLSLKFQTPKLGVSRFDVPYMHGQASGLFIK